MAMTVSSELRFPKCLPDALNIMIYFGTLNLGTYAAGGILATDISAQFKDLLYLSVSPKSGYTFEYDKVNNKVKAFAPVNVIANTGVADANNTIIKSAAGTLEVAGTGTAFQVVGVEVTGTPDLSTTPGNLDFLAMGLRS